MRYSLILILSVIVFASCSSEKKALKAFRNGRYEAAIDLFEKQLSDPSKTARANYFIAESYRLSNRVKESEQYYAKAGGRGIDKDTIQFFYAQALKANGKYDEARAQLQQLEANGEDDKMKDRAR